MTPKDILTLLDIVEKSGKSPLYAHITGEAHKALLDAQLHAAEKAEQNPPPKKAKE